MQITEADASLNPLSHTPFITLVTFAPKIPFSSWTKLKDSSGGPPWNKDNKYKINVYFYFIEHY